MLTTDHGVDRCYVDKCKNVNNLKLVYFVLFSVMTSVIDNTSNNSRQYLPTVGTRNCVRMSISLAQDLPFVCNPLAY
jgi:hypothetical protein